MSDINEMYYHNMKLPGQNVLNWYNVQKVILFKSLPATGFARIMHGIDTTICQFYIGKRFIQNIIEICNTQTGRCILINITMKTEECLTVVGLFVSPSLCYSANNHLLVILISIPFQIFISLITFFNVFIIFIGKYI